MRLEIGERVVGRGLVSPRREDELLYKAHLQPSRGAAERTRDKGHPPLFRGAKPRELRAVLLPPSADAVRRGLQVDVSGAESTGGQAGTGAP